MPQSTLNRRDPITPKPEPEASPTTIRTEDSLDSFHSLEGSEASPTSKCTVPDKMEVPPKKEVYPDGSTSFIIFSKPVATSKETDTVFNKALEDFLKTKTFTILEPAEHTNDTEKKMYKIDTPPNLGKTFKCDLHEFERLREILRTHDITLGRTEIEDVYIHWINPDELSGDFLRRFREFFGDVEWKRDFSVWGRSDKFVLAEGQEEMKKDRTSWRGHEENHDEYIWRKYGAPSDGSSNTDDDE